MVRLSILVKLIKRTMDEAANSTKDMNVQPRMRKDERKLYFGGLPQNAPQEANSKHVKGKLVTMKQAQSKQGKVNVGKLAPQLTDIKRVKDTVKLTKIKKPNMTSMDLGRGGFDYGGFGFRGYGYAGPYSAYGGGLGGYGAKFGGYGAGYGGYGEKYGGFAAGNGGHSAGYGGYGAGYSNFYFAPTTIKC